MTTNKRPNLDLEIDLEHIENLAQRLTRDIASMNTNNPDAILEMIDRHRAQLETLRERIATTTTYNPRTRATLDRLSIVVETVIDELDTTRARVDELKDWKWIETPTLIAGIPNDLQTIVVVAIASLLAQLTR